MLGFDIINEPLGANFFENPGLTAPGAVDRRLLQPLYRRFFEKLVRPRILADAKENEKSKAIASTSGGGAVGRSRRISFFIPQQVPSVLPIGGGVIFNAGFTEPPEGSYHSRHEPFSNDDNSGANVTSIQMNSFFNEHTYCCQAFPCDPFGAVYDQDREACR